MQDEALERLLRTAMAGEPPELSSGFRARVMQRVRPRGLSTTGRLVLAAYAVVASAAMVWGLRGVPMGTLLLAAAVGVPLVASASVYARRIALGRS